MGKRHLENKVFIGCQSMTPKISHKLQREKDAYTVKRLGFHGDHLDQLIKFKYHKEKDK